MNQLITHMYSNTCLTGHPSRMATSLFQPKRTSPKLSMLVFDRITEQT